jgi:uncharacterized membrane protein
VTEFWTSLGAAYLAAFVEGVEALTIVLAVASIHGWRPALGGAGLGAVCLGLLTVALGPLLLAIPLEPLHLGLGILLLVFGTRWLRKAVLRGAGRIPLRDESLAFGRAATRARDLARLAAGVTAAKAVLVEGLEVVFLVLALGASGQGMIPAATGAVAALLTVIGLGIALHRPLTRIPENALKFAVGAMAAGYGVFWIGEGLGWNWPGDDAAIPVLALAWAGLGLSLIARLRVTGSGREPI